MSAQAVETKIIKYIFSILRHYNIRERRNKLFSIYIIISSSSLFSFPVPTSADILSLVYYKFLIYSYTSVYVYNILNKYYITYV